MAMCGMARPEGVLVFAISLATVVYRSIIDRTVTRRDAIWCLLFLAVGVPYFAWRLHYFGYPFPNTFYVKTGRGLNQFLGGVLYTTSAIKNHGGLAFLFLALVPVFIGRASREMRYLLALAVAWLVYNVYKGHDVLPLYRFIVPILPIWLVLSIAGLMTVLEEIVARTTRFRLVTPLVVAFLAGSVGMNMVLCVLSRSTHPELSEYQVRIRIEASHFLPMAERLRQIGPPGSTIALIDIGAIPYITDWYTIDRYGLADAHIAHVAGRGPRGEKFDEKYVINKRPMFIQTHVTAEMERKGQIGDGWAGDPDLFSQPDFRRDYVRVDDRVLDGFFVRKDVKLRVRSIGAPTP
jgi:arabinofuranosyltransferase